MSTDPTNGEANRRPSCVRVGCAGWNIPQRNSSAFVGSGSHLQRYSQLFNCCEINSSFRRVHKLATWQRWAASVPGDFRFLVKVPRTITHDAKLECAPELLTEFLRQIRFLGDRLGPVLVQTPPSLEFETEQVSKFFSLLRQHYLAWLIHQRRES